MPVVHGVPNRTCQVYWGSHGCDLVHGHEEDHTCLEVDDGNPDTFECCSVDHDGIDSMGHRWYLYGPDAPTTEGRGE